MKLLYILLVVALPSLIFCQNCGVGTAKVSLDINNVKAVIPNNGALWYDGYSNEYVFPKATSGGLPTSAIFSGGLWLAGTAPDGNLSVAAVTFPNSSNHDFFCGPIDNNTGWVSNESCDNWDKLFSVYRADIDAHIIDFEDNGVVDNPLNTIFEWPGKNNPSFSDYMGFELLDQELAPFIDLNDNGIYEPSLGEYPDIKGDQAIWCVYNDIGNVHTETFGRSNYVEVQRLAYAYQSDNESLNNTTFYEYKILKKGTTPLNDFYASFWADFDLGCATDDMLGYDIDNQMMYVYNYDELDGDENGSCNGTATYGENIPMVGIALLESNTDENEVSSFGTYSNTGGGQSPFVDILGPEVDFQYYDLMKGEWSYEEAFLFSGDPSDGLTWSMCSDGVEGIDVRGLMSINIGTFSPGETKTFTYAVVAVEDVVHPCPSPQPLIDALNEVKGELWTANTNIESNITSINIYPNPSSSEVFIDLNELEEDIHHISIYDINGRLVQSQDVDQKRVHKVERNNLVDGIYFIKLKSVNGLETNHKIVFR